MPDGTIIVTGASRGIGAGIAADLAGRGYSVAALSRSGEAPTGEGYRCDVANEAALTSVIASIAAKGRIVGLVNNAGAHRSTPSAQLSVLELENTMRLNMTAALVASREIYPHLKQAGGGTIVNIEIGRAHV